MTERYALADDVLYVSVDDGSARLLDMNGSTFALSRGGAEILQEVLKHGEERAAQIVATRYGIACARVAQDARNLLGELAQTRLVRSSGADARRVSIRALAARAIASCGLQVLRLHRWPSALVLLARVSFALFGWANTVTAWQSCLRRADGREAPAGPDADATIGRVDATIRRAAAHVPGAACKERALCTWFVLQREGMPAALVVGLQLYPLEGHCWCEVGIRILSDYHDRCETYRPVLRYGPHTLFAGHAP